MDRPLVYALVVNWNGREHLEECFDSLLASRYANVRFVFLDNDSRDDSWSFVSERYGNDARLEMVQCGANRGWTGASNEGMQRALDGGADYVFLLNNDTVTAPDAIELLAEMAESRPEIGALAPKMVLYDEPSLINSLGHECSIIGSCWDRGLGRMDGPKWNERRAVIGACGGAIFLRASALRATGLFPDYEIYLEDLDLCLSIWEAGYEVWTCPEAVVRHKFSATMGQGERARRKYYLNTRNRFRLMLRHFPASKAVSVAGRVLWGECRAVGRGMIDGDWWKVAAHARAWASAVGYAPRALAERRRRRKGDCRFWSFVRTDRLFFQGTEFPRDGWYEARTVRGRRVRPIAGRAWLDWAGGRLRVVHANCYPRLGATELRVCMDGNTLASLSTLDGGDVVLDVPPGRIEIVADRIFDADETGESCDFGGWIEEIVNCE